MNLNEKIYERRGARIGIVVDRTYATGYAGNVVRIYLAQLAHRNGIVRPLCMHERIENFDFDSGQNSKLNEVRLPFRQNTKLYRHHRRRRRVRRTSERQR